MFVLTELQPGRTLVATLEYGEGNTFVHQPGIMLGLFELHLKFTKAA